ncbi:LysR family transcriptional regulator [Sulfitobacter sp. JB4-11]|uniref:LysR family transcriptional regulator n=1 Tax=Sulfitobacter rhodophyticola TaxID=3238304 RepID=UPI003516F960
MDRLIQMEAFAQVVDQGGFSDAARKMGISKSAVSKHISGLEARLGARLLNRTTRRVSPTEIGTAYYRRARQVLSDADQADALVSSMQFQPTGLLRISVASDVGRSHLMSVLERFLAAYPQVNIEMELNVGDAALIPGHFDLAIRTGDLKDSTLLTRKLADARMRVVASRTYIEQHGRPETIEDLANHTLLTHIGHQDIGGWKLVQAKGKTIHVPPKGSLAINDGQTLLEAAINGLGIAFLPSYVFACALETGQVVDLFPDLVLKPQGIHVLYPSGQFMQPKVRAFIDALAAAFADKGPDVW